MRSLLATVMCYLPLACGGDRSSSTSFSFIDVTRAKTVLETAGIRIEVTGGVRFAHHSLTSTSADSTSETTLNGHSFGLRDGVFFIGSVDYGPAPAGSILRVNDEGVFVGSERRGAVPADTGS